MIEWDPSLPPEQHGSGERELTREIFRAMMGQSGGRSQGHPTGDGARRRNTERERDLVDPIRVVDEGEWEPVGGLIDLRVALIFAVIAFYLVLFALFVIFAL